MSAFLVYIWGRIRPIFPINPIYLQNPIICPIYRSLFLFYLYYAEKIGNSEKLGKFRYKQLSVIRKSIY